MRYSLGALAFLLPLALLPGWSFYYDVTPKAVLLLAGAALLCAWSGIRPLIVETSRARRWNGWVMAVFVATAAIAAVLSPVGSVAWMGSDWRRMGVLTLLAVAMAGWAASMRWVDGQAVAYGVCGAGLLAGGYAVAQYAGWDPWLDASAYHFGEGAYRIVRPPASMGHANYLAAFLLWPVFLGWGLWRSGRSWIGLGSAVVAGVAIALCGSRGAWLGLAAGGAVWLWKARPKLRAVAAAAAGLLVAGALFYLSPAGEALRARMFWISEDSAGGSRLLLWRDALRMSMAHPLTGFGPDAFAAQFPVFQSAELSRAFPDFYHESPHNLLLDVLVSQGLPGLLALGALLALGIVTAARVQHRMALPLLAGLTATVVAHQFAVLILPTAFVLFVMLGLAVRMEAADERIALPRWVGVASVAVACALAMTAFQFAKSDGELGQVRRLLDGGAPGQAADNTPSGPIRADLYFSRRWVAEATRASNVLDKLRFARLAADAAVAAAQGPEQQQNAWYNLAMIQASANDTASVERSLRAAIAAAPTWYKPRWALARLLWLNGRWEQAVAEAQRALDLNGGHDAEVAQTLDEIIRSGMARR